MDSGLLQQFRQQLALWIEARLESQRLPFQRLELCPETLTDRGRLTPDMVLWINRDSQLAGSLILLPDTVDDQALADGTALAKALGLGHFVTWAAREVSVWLLTTDEPVLLHKISLPSAHRVSPGDFQDALDELLDRLKIITVTSAPSPSGFTPHYFTNLCLRNLYELAPWLTLSTRLAAGETAADEWVEQAPREKAWLSLWRILFLLWRGCLPPGLQPEKIERAIRYALLDQAGAGSPWLLLAADEPSLPDHAAVRLHHLAGRLRQLGWPAGNTQAMGLFQLLFNEAIRSLNLQPPSFPWSTTGAALWVNCIPTENAEACGLVAPRSCLAGWELQAMLAGRPSSTPTAEDLNKLHAEGQIPQAVAVLHDSPPPIGRERDTRLILLRQVWPNRRFELPRKAPAWIWDSLYLAGLISDGLTLALPQGWHHAPGIQLLWTLLNERYRLAEIAVNSAGEQCIRFASPGLALTEVLIHRSDQMIGIPNDLLAAARPGTIQVCLHATEPVVMLLRDRKMACCGHVQADGTDALGRGLYLFLHTSLGKYLWSICADGKALPVLGDAPTVAADFGIPLPDETVLADLSLIIPIDSKIPLQPDLLDAEFVSVFGTVPELSGIPAIIDENRPEFRSGNAAPLKEIADRVFFDGIPSFPEHYLMHVFKPALKDYQFCGPLKHAGEFFDHITLRTESGDQVVEVSGRPLAEALILVSSDGRTHVSLPEDLELLGEIVRKYQADLDRLWDSLTRECRRYEPQRQAAIRMARKIWRQRGLPPGTALVGK